MRKHLSLLFASLLYVGYLPKAPGTCASAAATLGFFLVFYSSHHILPGLHLTAVLLISLVGTLAADRVSRDSGNQDPSFVVIDEVAGQLLTFLFLPVSAFNLISGFLLFRILDIWKPCPIRKLESLKHGVGIMADDLLAGVYGNLILQAINYFI
jgi:phosphatidylglycerophosphatase A